MDILYISPQASHELTVFCEPSLIVEVLEHFGEGGKIIATEQGGDKPSRLWIITDYISNHTIASKKKLAVILSFAAIGGVIQIQDRQEFGNVRVLCMLKDLYYISEDDFDYFVDAFFNFSNGKCIKFK